MLTIKIDNAELEREISQAFGDDSTSLAIAFAEFIRQRQIKKDIEISISELHSGYGIDMKQAISDVRSRYE